MSILYTNRKQRWLSDTTIHYGKQETGYTCNSKLCIRLPNWPIYVRSHNAKLAPFLLLIRKHKGEWHLQQVDTYWLRSTQLTLEGSSSCSICLSFRLFSSSSRRSLVFILSPSHFWDCMACNEIRQMLGVPTSQVLRLCPLLTKELLWPEIKKTKMEATRNLREPVVAPPPLHGTSASDQTFPVCSQALPCRHKHRKGHCQAAAGVSRNLIPHRNKACAQGNPSDTPFWSSTADYLLGSLVLNLDGLIPAAST